MESLRLPRFGYIMIITFNAFNCGLGNNGGTRTILKSIDALTELGHECNIVARVDRFTWFKHKIPVLSIPENSDSVIAVSACDVVHSLDNSPTNSRIAWWMRGWETWQFNESTFISLAKKIHVIVNSSWMKYELAKYDIHADLCFAGLDI